MISEAAPHGHEPKLDWRLTTCLGYHSLGLNPQQLIVASISNALSGVNMCFERYPKDSLKWSKKVLSFDEHHIFSIYIDIYFVHI